MAPLTWRNVDRGGNFGDSVAALRLSGDLLNRGFDTADRALSEFDTWRTEQNDRMALASAQRIQDPAAYRAALESGTALGGINPTQLSARTLGLLDARSGALTERDAAAYANNRTQTTNAAMDAASPAIAALAAAARSGDPGAIAAAQRGLSLSGVPVDQVLRINRELGLIEGQAVSTQGGRITNEGGVIRNQDARFGLDTRMRDDMDRQGGASIAQNIADRAQTDADATRMLQEFTTISPGARAVVEAELRSRGFNINPNSGTAGRPGGGSGSGAPSGTAGRAGAAIAGATPSGYSGTEAPSSEADGWNGGTPSAPGTAGTRDGNPYDTTYNFRGTERPITSMTIAEVQELQRQHRQREGHSPMGAYQINHDTLAQYAPRVLGENWRSQQFTPDAQERIARAIFHDRRGGDITQTWSALRNVPNASDRGRFANTSWEDFRNQVSRAEVGRVGAESPAATVRAAGEAVRGIEERRGQNIVDAPLAREYLARATNTDDLLTVTRRMRADNGPLSHLNEGDAMKFIEDIISRSPNGQMRPAQAEAIIRSSIGSASGDWGIFSDRVVRPNRELARNRAQSLSEGTTRQAAAVDEALQFQAQQIQQATTRVEALQQEVRIAEQAVQNGQPRQQSLSRAQAQLRTAQAQLQLLLAARSDNARPESRDAPPRPRGPSPGSSWWTRPIF